MSFQKLLGGILLNLFVMPGSGHLALGFKKRGLFFTVLLLGILAVFLCHFMIVVQKQADEIARGNELRGMFEFVVFIGNGLLAKNAELMKFYGSLLGLGYLISVVDLIYVWSKKKGGAD
jgi:hypothetical protein